MRKVVEYKTVGAKAHGGGLEEIPEYGRVINKLIGEGWQPLGGISISHNTITMEIIYMQAMVKYVDLDTKE